MAMATSRIALRLARVALVCTLSGFVVAVPAAAAAPPTAHPAERSAPRVLDRGHIQARVAARQAKGVSHKHVSLDLPVPTGPGQRTGTGSVRTARTGARIVVSEPKAVTVFDGIANNQDDLGLEPPDPWIAVSGSYVVQSTNGLVRVYDRRGGALLSVPTWSLFGLAPSEIDSDPRILWDAPHARWVGVVLSFTIDGTNTLVSSYLNVAVSDTADPTAAWHVFSYFYTADPADPTFGDQPTLPDYPGLASSSDKVVLTANEYASDLNTYLGASFLVVRWSDILAGATPAPVRWPFADPDLWTIRPAIVQGSSSDVHLVASDTGTLDTLWARLSGSTPAMPSWTDLTAGAVVDGLCPVNQPRQPSSPSTIANALDQRFTDAVWRSNVLVAVSNCTSAGDDYVRVTRLNTATTPPTLAADETIGPGGGTDAYMGGIGFSGDGTLIVAYTQSSSADNPSTFVTALASGTWTPSVLVAGGASNYKLGGGRWGDYVGVAPDPSGTAAVWEADEIPDESGDWTTSVARIAYDLVAPTATGPTQALVSGSTLGGYTIPVRIAWAASDAGSGVAQSQLQLDEFGIGFFPDGSTSGVAVTRNHYWRPSTVSADYSYRYGVQPVDAYGNVGGLVPGLDLTAMVFQQTASQVTYAGSWHSSSSTGFSGGTARYSTSAGASASFKTSGRSFAFVTTRASSRGKAKVYVDGSLKTTLMLTSSSTRYRNLAYVTTFPSSGTHTIKVVVKSGRVDVDAFVALR
jgi:hypothetical protein